MRLSHFSDRIECHTAQALIKHLVYLNAESPDKRATNGACCGPSAYWLLHTSAQALRHARGIILLWHGVGGHVGLPQKCD